MFKKIEKEIGGRTLTIESGRMAKQANGLNSNQFLEECRLPTLVLLNLIYCCPLPVCRQWATME